MEDNDGSAHNLATEEITSKIVLTAIIVLFVAVLLVLMLHLYAKLFWWRLNRQQQQQQPQQQQQQQSSVSSQSTRRQRRGFIFVPGQDVLRSSGLDLSVLETLPVVVFRQEDFKDGLECAVCLSELVNGEKARLLLKCNHGFHVDCIDMWFQSHSTCPICRNIVHSPNQALSTVPENGANSANHHHLQSQNQNSSSGSSSEPLNFPTNVLVWGNQNQVSTGNIASVEDGSNNATASRSHDSAVVLEIDDVPANTSNNESSSSSSMRYVVEEEPKSPVTTRLRSLRRFLSRERRVSAAVNCSSSGTTTAPADA